ncbi:MAG: VCBS repeat-containing protein, partial [Myxococcota bacterium]
MLTVVVLTIRGASAAEPSCTDRLDDDRDGQIDCADPDCSGDAACCAGGPGDLDGDGACDARDVCPSGADPAQSDADGDGAGDACDVCPSWGDGLAAYGPGRALAGGAWQTVELGDVDGDGRLDVVAADLDGNRVRWFANLGGGAFADGVDALTGFDGPSALAVADLDGDADLDLVAGAVDANEVRWAENLGGGVFAASVLLYTAEDVWDVAVGDLDGDGALDVVSASWGAQLTWFPNLGGGAFGPARSVNGSTFTWASDIEVGDADGDGDLDVFSAASTGGVVAWWENTGSGSFAASSHGIDDQDIAYDLELADVDGDGADDVVAGVNWEFAYLSHVPRFVWYPQVDGGFGPAVIIADDLGRYGLAHELVDLDSDGDLDLVGAETWDGGVTAYANDGAGTFAPGVPLADDAAEGLAVGD